ncbi:hypothetical protein VN97_g6370 [Penicillium thymicola]|uniref:Uncharacterized protein n=1 Tax=Penicillium thymicola TaxID=293382 RepID=A0AAI9X7Q2_PENTH|nr:hypothetical protein VN97_g6370 [Penicillium thymicola]
MKHLPLAPAYLENQIFSHEPGPPGVVGYAECQGIEEKPVQIDQLLVTTTSTKTTIYESRKQIESLINDIIYKIPKQWLNSDLSGK